MKRPIEYMTKERRNMARGVDFLSFFLKIFRGRTFAGRVARDDESAARRILRSAGACVFRPAVGVRRRLRAPAGAAKGERRKHDHEEKRCNTWTVEETFGEPGRQEAAGRGQ